MKRIPLFLHITLLLALGLASPIASNAQRRGYGSIGGEIIDGEGKPARGATVSIPGTTWETVTTMEGKFLLKKIRAGEHTIEVRSVGHHTFTQKVRVERRKTTEVRIALTSKPFIADSVVVRGTREVRQEKVGTVRTTTAEMINSSPRTNIQGVVLSPSPTVTEGGVNGYSIRGGRVTETEIRTRSSSDPPPSPQYYVTVDMHVRESEEAASPGENEFKSPDDEPLSTFSIDVDAASYSLVRRHITMGQRPPREIVRIEEMINYFTYDYPQPSGDIPFSITTEVSQCPWNQANRLIHIGLQGREIAKESIPPCNLIFLIDVSGSMSDPDKLPLLKEALRVLVNELRPHDSVAIVVYAGAAGLVLPPTSGAKKQEILAAIDNLRSGGSTAGGAGIELAYRTAKGMVHTGANTRVILATDGDFNVGISSDAELVRLIEQKRNEGVFLTVLGFGDGNYQDTKMEKLADHGNGNYAYIDDLAEARKVFMKELGATLLTIAKDVKLQIEFNPAAVESYRLIGYENRMLAKEDFDNDRKDAGDLGAGHSVTALYEIVPADRLQDREEKRKEQDEKPQLSDISLKYAMPRPTIDPLGEELMEIRLRYKTPLDSTSRLIEHPTIDRTIDLASTSDNFRFSAAVAEFGLLLEESKHRANASATDALQLARGARGSDLDGYRAEFIKLVEQGATLLPR